jgi:hypothetical protein
MNSRLPKIERTRAMGLAGRAVPPKSQSPTAATGLTADSTVNRVHRVAKRLGADRMAVACMTNDRVGATDDVLTLFEGNIESGNLWCQEGVVFCGYVLSGTKEEIADLTACISENSPAPIKAVHSTVAQYEYEFDLIGPEEREPLRKFAASAKSSGVDIRQLANGRAEIGGDVRPTSTGTQSIPKAAASSRVLAVVSGRIAVQSEAQFEQFQRKLEEFEKSDFWRIKFRPTGKQLAIQAWMDKFALN